MKTYFNFFIAILLTTSSSIMAADELTVLADPWCPYNCVPNSRDHGFMIEVAEKVF